MTPTALGSLAFHVPGPPVGKGRPRATRAGRLYTPAATRAYGARVAQIAQVAVGRSGRQIPAFAAGIALDVGIVAVSIVAGSAPLAPSCRRAGRGSPRPDADNAAKAILDALNGVAWADDSQVWRLGVERWEVGREASRPRGVIEGVWVVVESRLEGAGSSSYATALDLARGEALP